MKNKEQLKKYAELLASTDEAPHGVDEGAWSRLNDVGCEFEIHSDALGYQRFVHRGPFGKSYGYKAIAEYFFILRQDAEEIKWMAPNDASKRILEMIDEHNLLMES